MAMLARSNRPMIDGQYASGQSGWQNQYPAGGQQGGGWGQPPGGPAPRGNPPPIWSPTPQLPTYTGTPAKGINHTYQYVDPWSSADQRAQARVDTGTATLQDAIARRNEEYGRAKDQAKADSEWLLRTGAAANMRHLQGQNAVNSGLRDRFAERLQNQTGRALVKSLSDLEGRQQSDLQDYNTQIANLKGSLPVLQQEEYDKGLATDATGINNALKRAAVTGRYLDPQGQGILEGIIKQKQNWLEAQARGDQPAMDEAHATANQLRMALQRLGMDPNTVEANVNLPNAVDAYNQMGVLTPERRDLLAGYYGIDPVTGQQTLGGRKDQQGLAVGDQNLALGKIKLDVAGNPIYGEGAAAQADIDYKRGLANHANALASTAGTKTSGMTTNQAAQLDLDIADRAKKAFDEDVKTLVSTYGFSDAGARAWASIKQELNGPSKSMTRDEFNRQVLQPFLKQNRLPRKDRDLLLMMYAGYRGDPAQAALDDALNGSSPPPGKP